MTPPNDKTPRDSEKNGIKITNTIYAMDHTIVGLQLYLSCAYALISIPHSWLTTDELYSRDCHGGVINFWPCPESNTPNRF